MRHLDSDERQSASSNEVLSTEQKALQAISALTQESETKKIMSALAIALGLKDIKNVPYNGVLPSDEFISEYVAPFLASDDIVAHRDSIIEQLEEMGFTSSVSDKDSAFFWKQALIFYILNRVGYSVSFGSFGYENTEHLFELLTSIQAPGATDLETAYDYIAELEKNKALRRAPLYEKMARVSVPCFMLLGIAGAVMYFELGLVPFLSSAKSKGVTNAPGNQTSNHTTTNEMAYSGNVDGSGALVLSSVGAGLMIGLLMIWRLVRYCQSFINSASRLTSNESARRFLEDGGNTAISFMGAMRSNHQNPCCSQLIKSLRDCGSSLFSSRGDGSEQEEPFLPEPIITV